MDALSTALFFSAWIGRFVATASSPEQMREWSDASGAHRALAVLLRVEGDRIQLRRSDGKLVSARVANLSDADRQYVAARQSPTAATSTIAGAANAIGRIAEAAKPLREVSSWLQPNQGTADDRQPTAAALVYIRVSRGFLEDYVERTIRRRKPVTDCVLGTRIVGESETVGRTQLSLIPSSGQLLGEINFFGTVEAHTCGYKGPVVLHNVSNTSFEAHKLIAMDKGGFRVAPATITGPTHLQTVDIDTSLPRLRGRIAQRIAWRKVSSTHDEAQAITGQHTNADVRRDFDARINQSVAKVQRVLGEQIPDLNRTAGPLPTDVRFRSSADCIELAILRENASPEDRKLRPPPANRDADLSVRVHRALFTSAIMDPQLIQDLAPMLMKLLQARSGSNVRPGASNLLAVPDTEAKWSADLEWLSLDFKDAKRG